MASTVPGASHWRALATVYGTIDLIAAFGLLAVLVTSVLTKRLRRNPVLLNFHLLFFVTAVGGTLIILAGHATDQNPPDTLCAASGIFISAAATGKAAAAFALTCQVWAHIMMLNNPNSKLLAVIASPRLLLPLPWIIYFVMLFVATGYAAAEPELVLRTSVYYCQVNHIMIAILNYSLAAIMEVITLIFAGWIAVLVIRVRQRALAVQSTRSQPVHRALAIRTMIFGGVLFVALVLEVVCLLVQITVPIPGMVLACIDLIAFIVFASDPILLRAFSKRIRGAEDTTSRSGPGVSGRPVTVSVHVARSGPQGDFDDEDGWDSPGAHSLRAYPKTIASVDESAGVDTKGSF